MFRVAIAAYLRQFNSMTHDPYHYQVIARALSYIEDTATDHPSLDDIASAVGLSPAHFQRVFTQWVGVSPKKYQQYLTLDHAKTLLQDHFTHLETAAETGLSGTSRLHDLFLNWEAMTPGDYARKGDGLVIRWGWIDSPFGRCLIMATDRGICGMAFDAEMGADAAYDDLCKRWPLAIFIEDTNAIETYARPLQNMRGQLSLHLIGAPLQIKVWQALLSVPEGQITTYSEIAKYIDNPKAVRAVGTAVGRNPVSWLIPCHRALRKSGALGGYHWGLPVKRALLVWESARRDSEEVTETGQFTA